MMGYGQNGEFEDDDDEEDEDEDGDDDEDESAQALIAGGGVDEDAQMHILRQQAAQ